MMFHLKLGLQSLHICNSSSGALRKGTGLFCVNFVTYCTITLMRMDVFCLIALYFSLQLQISFKYPLDSPSSVDVSEIT